MGMLVPQFDREARIAGSGFVLPSIWQEFSIPLVESGVTAVAILLGFEIQQRDFPGTNSDLQVELSTSGFLHDAAPAGEFNEVLHTFVVNSSATDYPDLHRYTRLFPVEKHTAGLGVDTLYVALTAINGDRWLQTIARYRLMRFIEPGGRYGALVPALMA